MLVVLLCGGDKSSQAKDIKSARTLWAAYKGERNEPRS
jgi:putative component of toxin-antitoxin plasmid stabilization module